MTKWARMRKRKERRRTEAFGSRNNGKETKLTQPENVSEMIQHSQEIEKPEYIKTSKPKTILAQIPRYAYLFGFFVLLSGIFSPLIIPNMPFDLVIGGTATLFLGLTGGILLFKAATLDNRQGIFIAVGLALIGISLILIFQLQGTSALIY